MTRTNFLRFKPSGKTCPERLAFICRFDNRGRRGAELLLPFAGAFHARTTAVVWNLQMKVSLE